MDWNGQPRHSLIQPSNKYRSSNFAGGTLLRHVPYGPRSGCFNMLQMLIAKGNTPSLQHTPQFELRYFHLVFRAQETYISSHDGATSHTTHEQARHMKQCLYICSILSLTHFIQVFIRQDVKTGVSSPFLAKGHSRLRVARVKTKLSGIPILIYCGIWILHVQFNTPRTRSFKLFKRPFPGFLTILTL